MIKHSINRMWKGERVWPGDPVEGTEQEKERLLSVGQAYDDAKPVDAEQTLKDIPYGDMLLEAGYEDVAEVNGALDRDLLSIDGIGDNRLLEIRNFLADDS